MAENNEVTFKLDADVSAAETKLKNFTGSIESMAKSAAGVVAGYLSFKALQAGLTASIEKAKESEDAIRSFNNALAMSGNYTDQASKKFEEFASSLEQMTGVQDDVILKNSALLVSVGKLSGEGLERATSAALDLAKLLRIDVDSAFNIVTKATQGNVTALSKYGLEVRKGATDSEKFAQALAFIEEKAKGLAKQDMNTFAGASLRLGNSFEKIQESVGLWFTRSPKLIALFNVMAKAFYDLSSAINSSKTSADVLVDGLFTVGKFITDYILRPLEIVGNFLTTGLMQMVTNGLTALGFLASGIDKAFGTDFATKIQSSATTWQLATQAMAQESINFSSTSSDAIGKFIDESKVKVDELSTKMVVDLPAATSAGLAAATSNWETFTSGFEEGLRGMGGDLKKLGNTMSGTLVNGMSNAFASMGKAIATGGDAFGEFGKQVLSTIGSLAIQLGNFLVLAGLGFAVIPGFQASAGAVVAGLALIVLGGVLQALGGGGKTPSAGGASGTTGTGGTSETVGQSPVYEQTREEERAKPQTGVQVVVQGNILNTRESALEIARVLSDSFDTNGTIVRGMA